MSEENSHEEIERMLGPAVARENERLARGGPTVGDTPSADAKIVHHDGGTYAFEPGGEPQDLDAMFGPESSRVAAPRRSAEIRGAESASSTPRDAGLDLGTLTDGIASQPTPEIAGDGSGWLNPKLRSKRLPVTLPSETAARLEEIEKRLSSFDEQTRVDVGYLILTIHALAEGSL